MEKNKINTILTAHSFSFNFHLCLRMFLSYTLTLPRTSRPSHVIAFAAVDRCFPPPPPITFTSVHLRN